MLILTVKQYIFLVDSNLSNNLNVFSFSQIIIDKILVKKLMMFKTNANTRNKKKIGKQYLNYFRLHKKG